MSYLCVQIARRTFFKRLLRSHVCDYVTVILVIISICNCFVIHNCYSLCALDIVVRDYITSTTVVITSTKTANFDKTTKYRSTEAITKQCRRLCMLSVS